MAEGSWLFAPGAFTHSPYSGTRVVQYAHHEPVEGLPDPAPDHQPLLADADQPARGRRVGGHDLRGPQLRQHAWRFDAQRERGFDASLQTLRALEPFRHNPYLFFGGLQGFGYGFPGYPGAVPGTPVPTPQGDYQHNPPAGSPATGVAPCSGPGCADGAVAPVAPRRACRARPTLTPRRRSSCRR